MYSRKCFYFLYQNNFHPKKKNSFIYQKDKKKQQQKQEKKTLDNFIKEKMGVGKIVGLKEAQA